MKPKTEPSAKQCEELLAVLRARFEAHPSRHPTVDWAAVEARLAAQTGKPWSLQAMEGSGDALYGECRYGRVFVGHNGAQSYYAARGFRGSLRV